MNKGGNKVNFLANLLSITTTNVANTATSECILYMWDEPTAPEEIL